MTLKRKHNPGCPCCPPPCKTKIAVQMWGCHFDGTSWSGVQVGGTVTVKTLGGTPVGTVSCDPDATPATECVVEVPDARDYGVTVQPDGYGSSKTSVLGVEKCETRAVIFQGVIASAGGVNVCGTNNCVPGATVTVEGPDGPVTWTTACPDWTCAPVLFPAGGYSWTMESPTPRLSDASGTFFVNAAFPNILPTIIGLGGAAPGYIAIPGCKYPIEETLHATTLLGGAITLNHTGGTAGSGSLTFDGTASYSYPGGCNCDPRDGVGLFYRVTFTHVDCEPVVRAVLYYSKHLNPEPDVPHGFPIFCPENGDPPSPALGVTFYGASLSGNICPESGALLLTGAFSGGGLPNDCLGSDSMTLSE